MKKTSWKRLLALLLVFTFAFTAPVSVQAAGKSDKKDKTEENTLLTEENVRLMSAIIFCEAGSEPYAGKVAVGIVIVNRMRSDKFPNSIENVIYQKGQFSPTRNGALKKTLKKYDNGSFTEQNHLDSVKAAIEVLEGRDSVKLKGKNINMDSYLFFSVHMKNSRLKIGNHKFK